MVIAHAAYLPSVECFALLPVASTLARTGADTAAALDYDIDNGCVTLTAQRTIRCACSHTKHSTKESPISRTAQYHRQHSTKETTLQGRTNQKLCTLHLHGDATFRCVSGVSPYCCCKTKPASPCRCQRLWQMTCSLQLKLCFPFCCTSMYCAS